MSVLLEPDIAAAVAVRRICELPGAVVVTELSAMVSALRTDADQLLLVGPSLSPSRAAATVRWARGALTGVTVVVLRPSAAACDEPELRACGAQAVLDLSAGTLPLAPRPGRPQVKDGRIITVLSGKGGVGKTVVATNLALALARIGHRSVCLVDLDLGFGDVALTFGVAPSSTHLGRWAGTRDGDVPALDPLDDAERLARVRVRHLLGVDLVPAPDTVLGVVDVPVRVVDGLLNTLPSHYDVVVVDSAAPLTAHGMSALDCAHHQVVVGTPERPALRNLRTCLDSLALLGYPAETRSVVLNRSPGPAGLRAWYPDEPVDVPVAAHVPHSRDVAESINRGVPLVAAQPHHPVSVALTDLAQRLLPAVAGSALG